MFAGFRCDYHPIRVPDTTAEFKQNPHWQPASQSWSLFDCLPMQRPQKVIAHANSLRFSCYLF